MVNEVMENLSVDEKISHLKEIVERQKNALGEVEYDSLKKLLKIYISLVNLKTHGTNFKKANCYPIELYLFDDWRERWMDYGMFSYYRNLARFKFYMKKKEYYRALCEIEDMKFKYIFIDLKRYEVNHAMIRAIEDEICRL